jgi:3-polyprenyl-4-hydroxybenzoate decarboxylase
LSYRRVKTVLAVDADIDLFNTESILWAMATRVRWDRDAIRVSGLSGSSLDPALPDGVSTAAKVGIDATIPAAARGTGPEAYAPVATVPPATLQRARDWLATADGRSWPVF